MNELTNPKGWSIFQKNQEILSKALVMSSLKIRLSPNVLASKFWMSFWASKILLEIHLPLIKPI